MIHSGTSFWEDHGAGQPATPSTAPVVTVISACPDRLTSDATEVLKKALDVDELSRLASFRDDDARRQYLVSHVLLRTALSAEYPVLPSAWRFSRSPTSAPVISAPPEAATLAFSLSHTRSLVVCAVSTTCRVGIDVEKIERVIDIAHLAPHVFSDDERNEWAQEEPARRAERFYGLWTLKEALLKAVGRGLRTPLTSVAFRLTNSLPPELVRFPVELGDCGEWSFRILAISNVHACALAVRIPRGKPLLIHIENVSLGQLVEYVHCSQGLTPHCASNSAIVARRAE